MKPDFIIFNGCSFTQGGGLENPSILNLYGYNLPFKEDGSEYYDIRESLRYSKIVSDYFNCDYVNLAESANSNENIFQTTFNYVEQNLKKLSNYKNINCFIQTTMSHRKSVKYKGEHINLNSFDKKEHPFRNKNGHYDTLQKWYEIFMIDIFDEKYEAQKTKKEIYTLREYLKSKNIKSNFLIYSDIELIKILNKKDYIRFAENDELMNFMEIVKLRICDEVDSPDAHFSPTGHKNIADILIKKIKND
jgi:hypothetical protein